MPVKFFYFNDRLPQGRLSTPVNVGGSLLGSDGIPCVPAIDVLDDISNPVYNFSQDFVKNMNGISPVDLAMSIPYIALYSLNADGSVYKNLSNTYFSRQADFSSFNNSARYSERPPISLQSVNIQSSFSTGGGFLTRQTLNMALKIDRLSADVSKDLDTLLMINKRMKLVYGWNSPSSIINQKDVVIFNIRDYNLSFDESGEATFTINGDSFAESFSTILVGDTGTAIKQGYEIDPDLEQDAPIPVVNDGSENVSDPQADNLGMSTLREQVYVNYLTAPSQQNLKAVFDAMAQINADMSVRAAKNINDNYTQQKVFLANKKKAYPNYFLDVAKLKRTNIPSSGEAVTVHDIIGTLCGPTFDALDGTVIPPNKKYRFVYGSFNEQVSSFAGTSIANFPIQWSSFDAKLKSIGRPPTLQGIINTLIGDYLANDDYWRKNLIRDITKINTPQVILHVSSHLIADEEIVQLALIDVNRNLPLTQNRLLSQNLTSLTEAGREETVIGTSGIPVVRYGHSQTFIKSIRMSNTGNAYLKALYINRATTTQDSQRQSNMPNRTTPPQQVQALRLPMNGEMTVIGQVDWRPGRSFYLNSGFSYLDGCYIIKEVVHTIDASGFDTRIVYDMH